MKLLTSFLFALVTIACLGQTAATDTPIHQLRIYEIPINNRQPFHDRFKDHVLRIMKKYDFHIVSIWESTRDSKLEFVYLLEWKNEQSMKTAWEKFMADQEWKDIKTQSSNIHGTFVDRIEDRMLTLTDYSPQSKLLNE